MKASVFSHRPVPPFTLLRNLAAALLLLVCLAASAPAQEDYISYPLLPTGYSSIKVFDREGRFVGRILPEKRYWVTIDRIPAFLQKAVVAVEDSRFYEHGGIDVRGIARALVKDVVKGRLAEGGSTITQQLVKNKYLSAEKTIDRKVREGMLAMEMEKKYSKRQILEMYFNEIYYGNGAWGIAQAARLYFDKNPEELSDVECSLLAGVQKNPGRYNPLGKPADVSRRRGVVLTRMLDLKMITPAEDLKLRAQAVTYTPTSQASWYLAHLKVKLTELFGPDTIEQGGLEVTAGMDLNLQKLAETAVKDGVRKISPELQGALVSVDSATGDMVAMVGGVEGKQTAYNRALVARRQPGSSIKPLIYAAALESGFTAATVMDDSPVAYPKGNGEFWKPQNYGKEAYGELPLRKALAYSNNIITVKLLDDIGVPYFLDFAGRMGLPLRSPNDLSLALGTDEVTLRDLVLAYSPFATGGARAEGRSIIKVYDHRRRTWTEYPPVVTPVLNPATAFVTTQMLKDVMTYGTAKGLAGFTRERPAAGKTGTTDDYRDAWFIGYTPQLVTGVWVGYDRPKPGGRGFTGGAVAAPIWERFMKPALAGKPVTDFTRPESVVVATIDPVTGCPPTPESRERRQEYFIAGTDPETICSETEELPSEPLPPDSPQPEGAKPSPATP